MANEIVTCCREWAHLGPMSVDRAALVSGPNDSMFLTRELPVRHCHWCGARFTLREDGTVEVGPSYDRCNAERIREADDAD